MMDIEKLVEIAPDWSGDTWANRLDLAASTLFLHGYITSRQRSSITQKLERQFVDGLESGRIIKAKGEQS